MQIDVPDTESGYPPPKPPRDGKDKVFKEGDCANIDANAKRVRGTCQSVCKDTFRVESVV